MTLTYKIQPDLVNALLKRIDYYLEQFLLQVKTYVN